MAAKAESESKDSSTAESESQSTAVTCDLVGVFFSLSDLIALLPPPAGVAPKLYVSPSQALFSQRLCTNRFAPESWEHLDFSSGMALHHTRTMIAVALPKSLDSAQQALTLAARQLPAEPLVALMTILRRALDEVASVSRPYHTLTPAHRLWLNSVVETITVALTHDVVTKQWTQPSEFSATLTRRERSASTDEDKKGKSESKAAAKVKPGKARKQSSAKATASSPSNADNGAAPMDETDDAPKGAGSKRKRTANSSSRGNSRSKQSKSNAEADDSASDSDDDNANSRRMSPHASSGAAAAAANSNSNARPPKKKQRKMKASAS